MKPRRLHEMYYETFKELGYYGQSEQPQTMDLEQLCTPELLPAGPAVYMVSYSFETLAYVGQTTNLRQRFLTHHRLPIFRSLHGDTNKSGLLSYRLVEHAQLHALESELIEHGKPALNNVPVQTPPVFVGAWVPHQIWTRLQSYAQGYAAATGMPCDIPTCVTALLAQSLV